MLRPHPPAAHTCTGEAGSGQPQYKLPCVKERNRRHSSHSAIGVLEYQWGDIIKATISAFYCCITNCSRINDLEQYPFVISPLCKSEVWLVPAGSSALSLTRLKSRLWPDWALTWRLWGRIHFHAYLGWWQNSFPWGCRNEVPISFWLSAVVHSLLLVAAYISFHAAHFIFKAAIKIWVLLTPLISLTSTSTIIQRKPSTLKGSCDYTEPAQMISLFQGQVYHITGVKSHIQRLQGLGYRTSFREAF